MATELAREQLSRYNVFGPRDTQPDRTQGRREGKQNKPPSSATDFSPYELQLIQQGRLDYIQYVRRRDEDLARLKQELTQLEHDRDEGFRARKDLLLKEKEAAVNRLRTRLGPGSAEMATLAARQVEQRAAVQRIELEVGRPLRVHFRHAYVPFMLLLSVIESPINQPAFELFFEEAPIVAWIIALGLGSILIYLSHTAGLIARRGEFGRTLLRRALSYGLSGAICVFAFGLIYLIAVLRQQLLDFMQAEQSFNVGEFLRSGGLGQLAQQVVRTELGTAAQTLLLLNVAVFLVGVFASFFRHDPHPDYEAADRARKKTERRLNKIQSAYERHLTQIEKDFDEKISFVDRELDRIAETIVNVESKIQYANNSDTEVVALISGVVRQRILAYQAGNAEVRADPYPCYFGDKALQDLEKRIRSPE